VFTVRYALSPYIKQIRFVFKGLILNIPEHTFSVSQVFIQEQTICLTSTCKSYSNNGILVACFVYLILSQKILDLTSDIKNLIFLNKRQCYVVFKKGISVSSFT
jgi:hypothetical protein